MRTYSNRELIFRCCGGKFTHLLLAATKLGQGNIFTSVCQEFCPQGGRVSASVHAGVHHPNPPQGADPPDPPGSRHPPWTRHPTRADTPRTRHPPDQAPPPSRSRHPLPGEQTPPPDHVHPPGKQTAAYGQRAAGTHPTGMHSCLLMIFTSIHQYFRFLL